jgi:outer membrane protein OmpA-like peptidoglycan-associated protein
MSAQIEVAEYSIKNLIVNTPYSDLSTSFWGKGRVIYASSKNSKALVQKQVKNNSKNKAFLEVFSAYIDKDYELKYSKKVVMEFDSRFNQSNVTFSPDLNYVYFTLNNQGERKKNIVNLKLYRAKVSKTGQWTNMEELPFNSNSYSCAHPTVSDDGKTLYFSSNMPGGYGDTDIYKVDILPNGKFSKPQNLGGYVNSKYKDNFPEFNQGLLYFSSNRPSGMGGLDVYMVPAGNLFIEPANLGEPVNSSYDDFSFVINENFRRGFFTSNRPQGKGGDDIYSYVQETAIKNCSQTIEIVVADEASGDMIPDAEVNLFDKDGKWINKFITDEKGLLTIRINKCNKDYKLEATKNTYDVDYADVIYEEDKKKHQVTMELYREVLAEEEPPIEIIESKKLDEDIKFIDVKSIEFILNKFDIVKESAEELDKVVKFMKEYPTIVVEFSAHTDSRGPDDWNLELTKLRAQEVVQYIVGKGIDYRRIYGRGYGETMPLNHCVNGVDCTDAEFLVNRRTEFLILAR